MKWIVKRQYLYAYVVLVCLPTLAGASDERYAPHIASMEQLASSYEREVSIERLAGEFSEFAGSRQFAEAIMSGLHEGKPIRFAAASGAAAGTISPGSAPMSLGNVYIAMDLAKMHLAKFGISRPTQQHIKIVLNGGSLTQNFADGAHKIRLPGVLKQRVAGQSWEAIARQNKLNGAMVGYHMQAANYVLIRPTASPAKKAPSPFFADATEADPQNTADSVPQRVGRTRRYGMGIVTAIGGSPASINQGNGDIGESIVTGGGDLIVSTSGASRGSSGL